MDFDKGMKICNQCVIEKSYEEFSKDRTKKDGIRTQCRKCCSENRKKFYKINNVNNNCTIGIINIKNNITGFVVNPLQNL
uniref:Stc1 domain-containing protein n=2 Tax=viral metagenome TaxID=1070528 RepID=A0A6M3LE18_9ZZZZ